jgi:hypothetical protein
MPHRGPEKICGRLLCVRRQCCKFRNETRFRRDDVIPGTQPHTSKRSLMNRFCRRTPLSSATALGLSKLYSSPHSPESFIAQPRIRSLGFAEPLIGVQSPFDRTMVLIEDVVDTGQVRATPGAEHLFLLYVSDGRTVDRRKICVDDEGLRLR